MSFGRESNFDTCRGWENCLLYFEIPNMPEYKEGGKEGIETERKKIYQDKSKIMLLFKIIFITFVIVQ